jgi:hypothetical protein
MDSRPTPSVREPQTQLIQQLCEAISTFVAATAAGREPLQTAALHAPANDNDVQRQRLFSSYDDVISLRGILIEFGLTQTQVAKLRKRCGFPAPIGRARPMMFRRAEVERWIRSQPDPTNFAIVLRSRAMSVIDKGKR